MHQLAAEVTRDVDQARTTLAKFFNAAKKEEIVFTRNTTEGDQPGGQFARPDKPATWC